MIHLANPPGLFSLAPILRSTFTISLTAKPFGFSGRLLVHIPLILPSTNKNKNDQLQYKCQQKNTKHLPSFY